jgi:hypothetical protein
MKLNQNPDMIKVMEDDLKTKAQEALVAADLTMPVLGVFSLDHLEVMAEEELGVNMAVGVAFVGTDAANKENSGTFNAAGGNIAKAVVFNFVVILALPAQGQLDERYDATKLLTVLRFGILGKPIAGDRVQRTWNFVAERPEIGESTRTMLYYSQVWQVAMQNLGNNAV